MSSLRRHNSSGRSLLPPDASRTTINLVERFFRLQNSGESFDLINGRRLSSSNKTIGKVFLRVDSDECAFDEAVRVVIFGEVHSAHLLVAEVQHRVIQMLRVAENAASAADQAEMALRRRELELQAEQILV